VWVGCKKDLNASRALLVLEHNIIKKNRAFEHLLTEEEKKQQGAAAAVQLGPC
jgi:hypothetical protein